MPHACSRRTSCRLCGSEALELALPIAPSPIGDHYVAADRLGEPQPAYPLDLFLCGRCGHLQLPDVVRPDLLFGDYTFETSGSPGLVEHFRRHAEEVFRRTGLPADGLVVEIGSNDGSLLRFYRDRGATVLGVDPAKGIAAKATAAGIETMPVFFDAEVARRIRDDRGPAALVEANNVYAHVDDIAGLKDGVHELLAPDGVFVFEVSYLGDIVDRKLFDTIYHEHLSYHAVGPLVEFFAAHGLELWDLERIPTKGGSMRGYVQRRGGARPRTAAVDELLALEARRGLRVATTFREFAADLLAVKSRLHELLGGLRSRGGAIAGFGASVTVTTLLHHFALGGLVDFLVDDNPAKHGLYSPGLHLPVVSSAALYERKPAAAVILAWQYADPIMRKHAAYLAQGGTFILPLPEPRVITA